MKDETNQHYSKINILFHSIWQLFQTNNKQKFKNLKKVMTKNDIFDDKQKQ